MTFLCTLRRVNIFFVVTLIMVMVMVIIMVIMVIVDIRPGKKQGGVVEKWTETDWDQEKIPDSNICISSDILLFLHIFWAVNYTRLRGVEAELLPPLPPRSNRVGYFSPAFQKSIDKDDNSKMLILTRTRGRWRPFLWQHWWPGCKGRLFPGYILFLYYRLYIFPEYIGQEESKYKYKTPIPGSHNLRGFNMYRSWSLSVLMLISSE